MCNNLVLAYQGARDEDGEVYEDLVEEDAQVRTNEVIIIFNIITIMPAYLEHW